MEPITYRLAVLLERCERISHDLTRSQTHLAELEQDIRRVARESEPTPMEVTR